MSSVASGFGRRSPRLEVVEAHATSQISELALCGLKPHAPVLTFFSNERLSCPSGHVDLEVSDTRIAAPFACIKSQFRTSSLDNRLVAHSFDLTLIGNLIEGWVFPCRVSEYPGTSFSVERTLRKLNDRILFDGGLDRTLLDVPKSVELIDYTFSFCTVTPLMHFSGPGKANLSPFCMS
ncbi:hypothetical protein BDR07DRAFT_36055 [Suillus spraguei]|nr:hypothetical protein BDR07DRAFT_36055 [Suillus spraguei]